MGMRCAVAQKERLALTSLEPINSLFHDARSPNSPSIDAAVGLW